MNYDNLKSISHIVFIICYKYNMVKKIGLLIGCNYTNTPNKLYGCQNDIIQFKKILITKYKYKETDLKILLDKDTFVSPTKENITTNLEELVKLSNASVIDEIFIYYSGHGSKIVDTSGDEPDGYDEVIVPLDFMTQGIIPDDYIYNVLSRISKKSKITCVFDSCNSASISDLSLTFKVTNNKVVSEILSKRQNLNKNIFIISGCADNNFSYDVRDPMTLEPCGLLSYSLRKALEKNNYICKIDKLLLDITSIINGTKLNQIPCITSGCLCQSNVIIFNTK